MTPIQDTNDGLIIALSYGGASDHTVASFCGVGGSFRFFDPNGGVMDFGRGIVAGAQMELWLEKQFKLATVDHYDTLQKIEVRKFTPKPAWPM